MGNKGQTTIIPGEMTKMNRARMANLRRNTYIPNEEELSNVTAEVKENSNIFTDFNGSKIVNNYRKETNETILPGVTNPALEELRQETALPPAASEEKGFFDISSLFGTKGGSKSKKSKKPRKTSKSRKSKKSKKTRKISKSRK